VNYRKNIVMDRSVNYEIQVMKTMMFLFFVSVINMVAVPQTYSQSKTNFLSFDYFSQESGLPNNQIQCIFQDRKGWIWLGTSQGLSRFDGYRFEKFVNSPDDTTSLSGNLVRAIFEDRKGNLLIGTENGGLSIFDRAKERFIHPFRNTPEFSSRNVSVNAIAECANGEIYLGTDRDLLIIDTTGILKTIKPLTNQLNESFSGSFIRALQFDNKDNLWIGTTRGLFLYHPETGLIENVRIPLFNDQSREVVELYKDTDGLIWIGTYSNGLYITDPATGSIRQLKLDPFYERSETIRAISGGPLGDYWIGTRGGLYVYSKSKGVTGFFRHDDRDTKSLANNSVLSLLLDSRGETWIGTRSGLNILAKSKQAFHNFSAQPDDNHYLNSRIIYAFWIDDKKKIWIGTEDGGINIYDPESGTYEYLTARKGNDNFISQNCIKAFLDDGHGNLWIGTFWGGIDVLNLKTRSITHFRNSPDDPNSLSDNRVWALCMDKNNEIWVGTSSGIDRFRPESKNFVHYPQITGDEQVNWISTDSDNNLWMGTLDKLIIYDTENDIVKRYNEHTRFFHQDSKKRNWVATMDKGIALYSKESGVERYYNERDGLSNNQALCILEDDNNKLWISTSNGLSKFDPDKRQFRNFSSRDGLRNNEFTYGAAYKSSDGELLFGGISGFNVFNPKDILTDDLPVPLVFTELRIFNKPVPISDQKNAILQKSITETTHLVLKYSQNVFTLEFSALDFVNSANTLYSYYLRGFDKDWNEPSSSRTATYTNLNPGDYLLRIKRVIPGNPPPEQELNMSITILPPFWMTNWFRLVMILTIVFLSYSLIRFIINREKIKNELVFEKTKAKNLHELDMLKLRLFTNISHEIRTPLTLILGPLEKLRSQKVSAGEIQSHLDLVYRNTRQLDRLINQLLDFRKVETGNLKLELSNNDIVSLVSDIVHSFDEYARDKKISLGYNSTKKKLIALVDPDKIETIINNLISNALKYTPEGGTVSVQLSLVFSGDDENSFNSITEKKLIEITVKDSGKGISQNNLENIFTRFFRVDSRNESTGTGIGLSLVKELVKLHGGNIYVFSKPGIGSKFTVSLPFVSETQQGNTESITENNQPGMNGNSTDKGNTDLVEKPDLRIMLIVEDNPDVRYFIKSHFESVYSVYEAKNGREGLELATKLIPDVIISDILMPDTDGYELCRRIRKDERTSHIPLLLLTALHSKEHEIEGLSCGADDYITKPFDISVLQTKIENMLSLRKALKEKYTREIILQPSSITISSPDERFLLKAMKIVENNISNSDLDIEQFASEIGVSRMQLYRKFEALTNMTVKEFIRSIRLKRATQLLLDKKMTVTEVAYAIGFKDLSSFRKSFHREYGMSASEYVKQNATKAKREMA
jgi:ligand-binding sensor domain-containing protein/signal transduction histidine kinase/DNA-binding response OmpR family regulator